MYHFSDSIAVFSGFAVTLSLVEHEHSRQAEIGIFELFKVSGFISLNVSLDCLLIPVSDAADARGRCNLDRSGFSMVFSCSTVACCLGSQRS